MQIYRLRWKLPFVVVVSIVVFVVVMLKVIRPDHAVSHAPENIILFGRGRDRRDKKLSQSELKPGIEISNAETVFLNDKQNLAELEKNFFKYLEKKDIKCERDIRLGNQHDGGWNVCLSPPFRLEQPCLVYSFGIGNDWRFEDEISDRYGCRVLAFDPSMGKPAHNRTSLIRFQPLGLGSIDEEADSGWQLKTLPTFLLENGHERSEIDYLKFDIEFMEWEVLESLLLEKTVQSVKQIGFEIHTQDPLLTPHKDLQTTKTQFLRMYKLLSWLEEFEFKKFNYRKNPFCNYVSNVTKLVQSRCYELHYVNLRFVKPHHLKSIDSRASLMR